MKNLFAVLLASLMLFSFAACSSETDSSSDTNRSNVETVTTDEESGSDSTEETTDETDSETAADATDETGTDATGTTDETASDSAEETAGTAEQQTITGTILDATMNTVTIQTADGEELSFSIPDDADKTEVNGMTIGDTLEVTYIGTVDGADTAGATVVKLVQISAE